MVLLEIIKKFALNCLKEIAFHKSIASRQRISYNESRSNVEFLKRALILDIDFKQKVTIGMGPRQVNKEYYNQIQLSVFGVGIFFYDLNNRKINLLYVDVIADVDDISSNI